MESTLHALLRSRVANGRSRERIAGTIRLHIPAKMNHIALPPGHQKEREFSSACLFVSPRPFESFFVHSNRNQQRSVIHLAAPTAHPQSVPIHAEMFPISARLGARFSLPMIFIIQLTDRVQTLPCWPQRCCDVFDAAHPHSCQVPLDLFVSVQRPLRRLNKSWHCYSAGKAPPPWQTRRQGSFGHKTNILCKRRESRHVR